MKLVFMGTPDFAASALEALIRVGHTVTAVVTQPDRPKGRSGHPTPSPVKECALRCGIEVFQPERIKAPEAVERLRTYPAEVYVVAAFGQILPQEILDLPTHGCLNIHASILPKYRGASPIQCAILHRESETGVTVMQMDAGVDTGDIRLVKRLPIEARETFETLHDKLSILGGEAIVEALALLEQGSLERIPQNDAESSRAPLIHKEDGELDFSSSAAQLDAKIRAMNPWPGAFTCLGGKILKIWSAEPEGAEGLSQAAREYGPGCVCEVGKDFFCVRSSDGAIRVREVQLEGKKRMETGTFLLGTKLTEGQQLGEASR